MSVAAWTVCVFPVLDLTTQICRSTVRSTQRDGWCTFASDVFSISMMLLEMTAGEFVLRRAEALAAGKSFLGPNPFTDQARRELLDLATPRIRRIGLPNPDRDEWVCMRNSVSFGGGRWPLGLVVG